MTTSRTSKILLVEDEALIALDMEDLLAQVGFEVAIAHNVRNALELVRGAAPDLGLLDVSLAGEMVWPVADALRAAGAPYVLLTGFGRSLEIPQAHAGAPVLAKPVDSAALVACLRELTADASR